LAESFALHFSGRAAARLEEPPLVKTLTNNHTCEEFVKTFNTTSDHHAPYCFVSSKEQRTFEKPWLTKGILKSIVNKNKMLFFLLLMLLFRSVCHQVSNQADKLDLLAIF